MRLQKKLQLTILCVALIPYIGGMFFLYSSIRDKVNSVNTSLAKEYALAIKQGMESYFDKLRLASRTLSKLPEVKKKDWKGIKDSLNVLQQENSDISGFVIGNPDGSYWYSLTEGNPYYDYRASYDDDNPEGTLKSLSNRSFFKALITENTTGLDSSLVSDIFTSNTTGERSIAVASTVLDYDGNVNGIVASYLGANELSNAYSRIMSDLESLYGKDCSVLITYGDKQILTDYRFNPQEGKYVDYSFFDEGITPVSSLPEDIVKSIKELKNLDEGENSRFNILNGVEYFSVVNRIAGSDYYIYLNIPTKVLFATSATIRNIALILGVIITVSVICVAYFIGRRTVRPINKLIDSFISSKETGDLSIRVNANGNNEVGDLSRCFNDFMEEQHTIISKITDGAAVMSESSDILDTKIRDIKIDVSKINENINLLNSVAEDQNASTTETAASVEEISKNVESLSRQIQSQSSAVEESSAAIQQMVSNIGSISNNLEKASVEFETLKTASQNGKDSISNVVELVNKVSNQSEVLLSTNNVINSIAAQTNLLAMNAEIEAAHAGAAGMGFSVVADEIRKLAEESSSQSKIIATELKKIVADIGNVVNATTNAGAAFDTVVNKVEDAGVLISQIALAMQEQNEGSRQVLEALDNIQNITLEIKNGSIEMNEGTTIILNEMNNLEDISRRVHKSLGEMISELSEISTSVEAIVVDSCNTKNAVTELSVLTEKFSV